MTDELQKAYQDMITESFDTPIEVHKGPVTIKQKNAGINEAQETDTDDATFSFSDECSHKVVKLMEDISEKLPDAIQDTDADGNDIYIVDTADKRGLEITIKTEDDEEEEILFIFLVPDENAEIKEVHFESVEGEEFAANKIQSLTIKSAQTFKL